MCQPLLDAVAAHLKSPMLNHTLQRTFGPAVRALHGPPLRYILTTSFYLPLILGLYMHLDNHELSFSYVLLFYYCYYYYYYYYSSVDIIILQHLLKRAHHLYKVLLLHSQHLLLCWSHRS